MTPEQIFNIITNNGISVAVTVILLYFGYRYMNLKLKLIERQFNDKMKEKAYNIKGNATLLDNDSETKLFIDFTLSEEKQEK